MSAEASVDNSVSQSTSESQPRLNRRIASKRQWADETEETSNRSNGRNRSKYEPKNSGLRRLLPRAPVSAPSTSSNSQSSDPEKVAARSARINAHLQASRPSRNDKPCFAYFGRERKCDRGDECKFSHDDEKYKQERGLKDCPNQCGRFCLESSNQCSNCVQAMHKERQFQRDQQRAERKADFDSRPEQQCQAHGKMKSDDSGYEWECPNMTKYRLCSSCHKAERAYMQRIEA